MKKINFEVRKLELIKKKITTLGKSPSQQNLEAGLMPTSTGPPPSFYCTTYTICQGTMHCCDGV